MVCNVTRFTARQGTLAYATGAVTWDSSTTIASETFTGNVVELKDVTVEIPKQEFDKVDFLGNLQQTIGANAQTVGTATGITPGYWQIQGINFKSVGMAKFSGTMVLTGDEQFAQLMSVGTSQAITGSYTRYGMGTLTSGGALTQNVLGSVRLFLNNGSEETTFAGSNIHLTLGEIKPTGTDGHYECGFEAYSLAKDFAMEYKD